MNYASRMIFHAIALAVRLVSSQIGTFAFVLGAPGSRLSFLSEAAIARASASSIAAAAAAAAVTTTTMIQNSGNDDNTTAAIPTDDALDQGETNALDKTTKPKQKKNPIDIFGIDHVVLLVDDLPGMCEWYQTVLGCKVAKHNEELRMIHLDAGSSLIDLVDREGPLGRGGTKDTQRDDPDRERYQRVDHVCLGLTDFDEQAIRDHLEAHGVSIFREIGVRYGKGGDGESLYFKDPEGTTVEIKKTLLLDRSVVG